MRKILVCGSPWRCVSSDLAFKIAWEWCRKDIAILLERSGSEIIISLYILGKRVVEFGVKADLLRKICEQEAKRLEKIEVHKVYVLREGSWYLSITKNNDILELIFFTTKAPRIYLPVFIEKREWVKAVKHLGLNQPIGL